MKLNISKSIHTRLIAGYTAVLFISICMISLFYYVQTSSKLTSISKQYLSSELKSTIELSLKEEFTTGQLIDFLSKQTVIRGGPHKIWYALFDKSGLLIARSMNFKEHQESVNAIIESGNAGIYEATKKSKKNGKYLLATRAFKDFEQNMLYLQFGLASKSNRETLAILLKSFLWAAPIVLIIAVVGGYFLTNRVLSPIVNLTKQAGKLSLTTLEQKLPVTGSGDELDQLAGTFNSVFKKLHDSYQRIVTFTANVSHELRLPITAIKGEAEVVLERERNLGEYQKVLESIVEEISRLIHMINQLLTLTRGDSGTDKMNLSDINLPELLKRMVEFYSALAENKHIELSLVLEAQDISLNGDTHKLEQLFSNLIDNAIRYTPENGKVQIKLTRDQHKCYIAVSDTGIGIPEDEKDKIFERFYRIDKARSRKDGNVGLGLSIAEMIAKEHNGNITVASAPNQGSCFTVNLPCI